MGDAAGLHGGPHDVARLVGGRPRQARLRRHVPRTVAPSTVRVPVHMALSMPGADSARLYRCATSFPPGPAHMEAAWKAVRRFLAVTPLLGAPRSWDRRSPGQVETVQPTGSFKVRGGLAAVAATLEEEPGRVVVASSAGNHGLGLAYAASSSAPR